LENSLSGQGNDPPLSVKKEKLAASDGFECVEGVCTITLRDGRTLAYTAQPAMQEIACNIGDVVILAVPGKDATCRRSTITSISKRDLALKGAVEIRLGQQRDESRSPKAATGKSHETARLDKKQPTPDLRPDDRITYAVDAPSRPWHLHRIHSRAARGLPEREYKPKSGSTRNVANCSSEADDATTRCN